MESHLEARLWNDAFVLAQDRWACRRDIRATVLIETILAAFEMEEILYELRDHCAGLNAGRWDYMFSVIKKFRDRPEFVLPDRPLVTMTVPFMRAYTELLVKTCHRRGAHAIGGMAAFIPISARSRGERRRAGEGHRGQAREPATASTAPGSHTPISCPAQGSSTPCSASDRTRSTATRGRRHDAAELLDVAATPGEVTEAGVRTNV